MKSLILLFIIFFVSISFAQNVPTAAKTKLKSLYPKAEKVKWDKETPNFEANFEVKDVEMSLLFDARGNLLETETEISSKALPQAVKTAISKDFNGYSIEETAKIVRSGKTTFEAQLEKGENKLDAIYNSQGTLIKKIVKKEKDEEEKGSSGEDEEDND